ncbi:MAG: PEGA domain-containing protein [Ignavibacteria bacterium]|nr:PEGA domain-containing protein [Ignavibacteria bacterium]
MIKKIIFAFVVTLLLFLTSCEKEVFTGPPDEPEPKYSHLAIQSNPSNATIFLNGKNMGLLTPDSLKWLKSGFYTLTLKLGLFEDTSVVLQLKDGINTSLFVDYYLNPGHFGKIECTSVPPGANIFLNNNNTGFKTPYTFSQRFPGPYKIKLTYPEHRADSSEFYVRGGKTAKVNFVLDDTTKWVNYNTGNSPLPADYLSVIVVDKNNIKWFGMRDRGLVRHDGKKWVTYNKSNSWLPFDAVNCLKVDNLNRLWVGTTGGLVLFDGNTWTNLTSNLPSGYVTAIDIDQLGNVWVGTTEGIVKYNGSTWQLFRTNNSGLPGNLVTCISTDKQNRVWVGTNAFGLGMFNGSTWYVWNMSNMNIGSNYGNGIRDVKIDLDGNVWVAHVQNLLAGELGGVTKYNGSTWARISVSGILVSQTENIYIDGTNNIWLSTKTGIGKFLVPSSAKIFTTANSKLPASQVLGVAIDKNDDVWVGTFGGGVSKIKKGNY